MNLEYVHFILSKASDTLWSIENSQNLKKKRTEILQEKKYLKDGGMGQWPTEQGMGDIHQQKGNGSHCWVTENGNMLLQELLVLFASSWAETCTNTIALPKRTAPVHREELRALVDADSSISVPSLVNLPITANPYQ